MKSNDAREILEIIAKDLGLIFSKRVFPGVDLLARQNDGHTYYCSVDITGESVILCGCDKRKQIALSDPTSINIIEQMTADNTFMHKAGDATMLRILTLDSDND